MNKVLKGLNRIGTFYVGNSKVKKMYVGEDRVFPPYDAEIEYLESTGTQWIDTGVTPTSSLFKAEVGMDVCSYGKNPWGLASLTGDADWFNPYSFDMAFFLGSSRSISFFSRGTAGVMRIVSVETTSGNAYIMKEGTAEKRDTYGGSFLNNPSAFFLFTTGAMPSSRANSGRIYYCKLWQNGNLLRYLIPIRIGQVGYMYDKVSGQLFENAGTGAFIIGPDIV